MNSEIKFKKFPLTSNLNEELGSVVLEHLWADVFALKIKVNKAGALVQLNDVILAAISEAEIFRAQQVVFRLIKGENSSDEIRRLLPPLGFVKKNERVEFKKSLNELPSDAGSPMTWKTAEELSWSPQDIAHTLKVVAEGDPDTDPNDDPFLFIQDFLADPVLSSGLRCVHIGFMENELAALAVVQINPKTGWSRISYMGIVPKFRKQNLGLWVHRHCFTVMKAQGGELYHGGTAATNAGMIRLFEKHQCHRFSEMEEWNYSLKRGDQC